MQNKKNKVKYNLKNTHYAMLTVSEDGVVSYGTPIQIGRASCRERVFRAV